MDVAARTLAGLLAEDRRRRVVAALLLGASSVEDVKSTTGMSTRDVATAMNRLVDGGLVEEGADRAYAVATDVFQLAARAGREDEVGEDLSGLPSDQARVVHAFVRDGRLVSIPTQRAKRLVILARLAGLFDPALRYTEAQVNAILVAWHPDTASLRRHLVDEDLLRRDHGEYWRTAVS